MLTERLGRLSGSGRRAVDAAAVIGEEFSIELLSHVLGALPETVLEHLTGAVKLGLIEAMLAVLGPDRYPS